MEAKHTPGPWKVSDRFGSVGAIAHSGGFVAFPCQPRDFPEARLDGESWLDMRDRTAPERLSIVREQDANARLIAAAPELLEALERLSGQCDRLRYPGQSMSDAEKNALAVISKAKGA